MEIIKLENENGELIATSLEIARVTGKEHSKVLRDVREKLEDGEFGLGSYLDKQGQERAMYTLKKKALIELAHSYTKKKCEELLTWIEEGEEGRENYIEKEEEIVLGLFKAEQRNGKVIATSKQIAELLNRNHKDVMKEIRVEFSFEDNVFQPARDDIAIEYYKNKQNKDMPMYVLGEYETIQLMMKYSSRIRKVVLDEFKRMKEYIKSQQESKQELSTLDILKIATAEIEKLEQENKTLALTNETQSKQLDIYLKFGDNIGLREFTKRIYTTNSIDWSETRVKEFILGLGLLITSNKKSWNLFRPYAGKAQEYFLVKSTEQEFGGKIRTQLLITPQGQAYIVEKMLSE